MTIAHNLSAIYAMKCSQLWMAGTTIGLELRAQCYEQLKVVVDMNDYKS